MGRVFLGRSPGGRHVAVKVIRPELADDAQFRARFAREVSAARKVSGIFTAQVVDADLSGPVPWLVTSYVAGPSLDDMVAARGPLREGPTISLLYRVAAGEPATRGLPPEIRPPIERCLAKDPWRRPTASALLAELSTVPPATQAAPGLPGPEGGIPPSAERAVP